MRLTLTHTILIAMLIAILFGSISNLYFSDTSFVLFSIDLSDAIGRIFLACLQLVVVPLVLVSILNAVINTHAGSSLGVIGFRSIFGYLLTTVFAISIGLLIANICQPGFGSNLAMDIPTIEVADTPNVIDVVVGFFPTNPFRALIDGNMIQVIILALIFGLAIRSIAVKVDTWICYIDQGNMIMFEIVDRIIRISPIGVFALIFETFATEGSGIFLPLIDYFLIVILALLIHASVTYSLLLMLFGISPIKYFKNMQEPIFFAFSTASSAATIPVTLKALNEKCGIDRSVTSFVIPIGATINMDGTAIMQGVAAVFISNLYGIDLVLMDYVMIVFTATLASIGTASVPSAGLIMLTIVLNQVGLPIEGIGLIIGVDRILDMVRTSINISGDGVISCIIAKLDGSFNRDRFLENN